MRQTLRGLPPLAGMLAVMGLAVVVTAVLVQADAAALLVPPPEQVAEQLVKALQAHNFEAARATLSDELQAHVSEADLQALEARLEQQPNPLAEAEGESSRVTGAAAEATVTLAFADSAQQPLKLALAQSNGLWRVSSLAPLYQLAGQAWAVAPGAAGTAQRARRQAARTTDYR